MNNKPRLLKTDQDKEEFIFWIETLRAGVLPQTDCALEDSAGFCCLGVAVACTVPETKLELDFYKRIKGGYPSSQEATPLWLRDIDHHSFENYGYEPSSQNDALIPHPEIADKLFELYKWELES